MANVTISGTTIGGDTPNSPTNLTAVASFDGVSLNWTNPTNTTIDYIQIVSANVNNRANTTPGVVTTLANVKSTAFYDHTTSAETRYYWVRAVSTLGLTGNFNANATSGVSATPQEVTVTAPVNNEVLLYDSAQNIWRNGNIAGGTGYTGSAGAVGYTGSQGDLGYTGSIGYTGSQGDIGYTGSSAGFIANINSPAQGNVIAYNGTEWVNTSEISQNISGNAVPTITRATTSTSLRSAFRVRKTLTSGSRTDGDGPNINWSYLDSTSGYDYGGMRFRYAANGDHDFVLFTSTDTSNAFSPANTLAIIGPNVSTFYGGVQSNNPDFGIGYTTGAGSTVTQLTSKATGVTIDTPTGNITCNAATLNSATNVSFTVTNAVIEPTDSIIVNVVGGTASITNYWVWAGLPTTTNFQIGLRNITGGSLSEAVVIRYTIIKGSSS